VLGSLILLNTSRTNVFDYMSNLVSSGMLNLNSINRVRSMLYLLRNGSFFVMDISSMI